jgi:hypothetical protein
MARWNCTCPATCLPAMRRSWLSSKRWGPVDPSTVRLLHGLAIRKGNDMESVQDVYHLEDIVDAHPIDASVLCLLPSFACVLRSRRHRNEPNITTRDRSIGVGRGV